MSDPVAFDPKRLLAYRFEEKRQRYSERDAIIYALGVGLGYEPLDARELAYLLEDRLRVLPTMAVTLGTPGLWVRDPSLGIDVVRLVHSAQAAMFHAALPPSGDIVATARIAAVADRGAGKGAVVVVERSIRDANDGTLYCTLEQTLLLRGNGGFGGAPPERRAAPPRPERAPDRSCSVRTSIRSALIYRLSGDLNPLHADPKVAQAAGFGRPILHGLASYGLAGWVAMSKLGGDRRLASLSMRFAGVVMPGDLLTFELWSEPGGVMFEAQIGDRTVLADGHATFAGQGDLR